MTISYCHSEMQSLYARRCSGLVSVTRLIQVLRVQGPYHVEGSADGADHVAPDATGVHDLHGCRQLELGQLAHFRMEKDLKVALQHRRQLVAP